MVSKEKISDGVGDHTMKVIRYCIICAPDKLPPKLHVGGSKVLQNGEFSVVSTSKRLTCSAECSKKYLQNPQYKDREKKHRQTPEFEENTRLFRQPSKIPQKTKRCIVCGIEFVTSHGTKKNCSAECSEKSRKKLMQSPKYKAKKKQYQNLPEVKINIRWYRRDYDRRDDVKAKKKKYLADPYVKARGKEYQNKYRNIPENRKKKNQSQREYDSLPENKKKKSLQSKKYYLQPEVYERKRKYRNSPEGKAKQKKYKQLAKAKKLRKLYATQYYLQPNVKERKMQYNKERYRQKKIIVVTT